MNTWTRILNNYINRIVIFLIFSLALASPYLNKFTTADTWLVLGVILFSSGILSCVFEYQFTNKWSLAVGVLFVIIVMVIFSTWSGY